MLSFKDDKLLTPSEIVSFYGSVCKSVNPHWDFNSFVYISSTSVELSIKNILRLVSGFSPSVHNPEELLRYLRLVLNFLGFRDLVSRIEDLESDSRLYDCLLLDHSVIRYNFSTIVGDLDWYSEENFDKVLYTILMIYKDVVSRLENMGYALDSTGIFRGLLLFNNMLEPLPAKRLRGRFSDLSKRGFDVKSMEQFSKAYYNDRQLKNSKKRV